MIKLLTAAALTGLAAAASAQTASPPAPPPAAGHQWKMMDNTTMSRDEMVAKAREHFAMMDKNKDGVLTADEMGGMGEMDHHGMDDHDMGDHDMAMRDMPMPDPDAMFDRIDTNKDGMLSRDEFAKGRQIRIEKRIVMKDGDKREFAMMPHMHAMGGHMFKMADSNNDGKVTLAEAQAMAAKHFDEMDANHDGKLTPEERMAGRKMMVMMKREEKAN